MSKLSTDFAFEGFRLIRERPIAILIWGLVLLVFNGSGMYIASTMIAPAMADFTPGTTDPTAVLALYAKIAPAYGIILPLSMVQNTILSCAIFRCALGAKDTSLAGLRLGIAELRQLLVTILFGIVFLGIYLGSIIGGFLIGMLFGSIFGLISPALATVGVVIGFLAALGVFLWFMARLSLAQVQSFDTKRINLFGSWRLTAGHTGELIVGYAIMFVMMLLVAVLCLVILAVGLVAVNGGNLPALMQFVQSVSRGTAGFDNPNMIAYALVLNLIVMPLLVALSTGAPAAAYVALAGTSRKSAESVF